MMSPYLFRSNGLQIIGKVREHFYKYNIVYYNRFEKGVSTKKERFTVEPLLVRFATSPRVK